MRIVVQRVTSASVTVEGQLYSSIGPGLLLLVGILEDDNPEDMAWCVRKVSQLRVFNDDTGMMNRSVMDVAREVLSVSQFTLYATLKKGNRPSYSRAARAHTAGPLFEQFVSMLSQSLGKPVPTGVFGAEMDVALINDGPVTLWLDSRSPE